MPFISLIEKSENINLSLDKNKDKSPIKISEPSLGQKRKFSDVFSGKNLDFEKKKKGVLEKILTQKDYSQSEIKMTGDLRDFLKRFKK
jgi:hypothetical protein